MMTAKECMAALERGSNPEAAMHAQRFFKTGEGQYGAGDEFIGVRVPVIRLVCKQFAVLPLSEV